MAANKNEYKFLRCDDGIYFAKPLKNGGISKVSQVEYIDKSIFFGLVIQHTTRVYGE